MEGLVGYDSKFQVTDMSVEGDDQLEVHVDTMEGTTAVKNNFVEITLYALLGSPSLGTIRVLGCIKHKDVVIFIDSGSTHNFLDVSTWLALAFPLSIEDTFEVKVANGSVLQSRGVNYGVSIKTQGGLECITSW